MRIVLNGWRLSIHQDAELEVSFEGPFVVIKQYQVDSMTGRLLPFKTHTLTPAERARTVEGQRLTALRVE